MEHKQHPEQAYRSCSGILNIARKVGPRQITSACRRAHSNGVYNYPIILQILGKNMDNLDDEQQTPVLPMPQHLNIRGSDYYQ
jgi:hypothetical protein